ncbi:LysM peptidoglycan-binding domain-containing protein [Paenibacillus sp. NEAU-GSW1]|uniref:LysM peptidoglycan-binding domain-containing protein n=1 Tax=Paenibacillus sp. NEAU-GSW1 TaxID=2682486 RepID=UPI0015673E53|nr:LysM peptidoglycan-binding domain-containing protein [Paenibacillus sp. NEAU-GSW1]
MMMMNPSFYKSIHKKETAASESIREITGLLQRHALKAIVSIIVFVLLFSSFLLIQTNASGEVAPVTIDEQVIIVASGDTLWEIADRFTEGSQDIRRYIYDIKQRNQLSSSELMPGQQLIMPKQ